jgi:hypothetical protein
MKTENEKDKTLLTEVPSTEEGALLTEIIPDEVKKEEELLTEEKDTSAKESANAPREKKSKRELKPKKEAPPAVIEAIEKIAAIELAKEEAAAAETTIVVEATPPPVVDIGTPPGTFFPEDEEPCTSLDRARRGFRFVKKKTEEYTPSERKSLLKNFSRRTLRTRYGIEF